MTWARFLAGTIQRQLILLAIGPVVLIAVLGQLTEPLIRQDPESDLQARAVAMRIEMAVDMVRAAETVEQKASILNAVTRTGLGVREAAAAELKGTERSATNDFFLEKILDNLPLSLPRKLRSDTVAGQSEQRLVVGLDETHALAFALPEPVADSLITDGEVNSLLIPLALLVPVVLLSLYASRMIASPLSRFSRAARDLEPDTGPERPFEEMGSLEVRMLARSLNDMRSRVRGMIDARTRMLRAISHDLRTPLTRLRLRAERSDQPSLKNALLADIDALNFMIEETLIYLRKDALGEELLKADLPSILMTVCTDFADMGHSVTYHGPERFAYFCRPHALQRAIANLIDNGTKSAQRVDVELQIAADRGAIIRVSDNGPGIPSELQARALEPFFKLDSARGERGGFGLGLSIVQDIVHAHLGTMTLGNATPNGLIVEICLPLQLDMSRSPVARGTDGGPKVAATGLT